MKNNYLTRMLTVAFCLLSVTIMHAQPEAPAGKEWQIVPELTDEFDSWDGTKWEKSFWNYDEPNLMTDYNTGVKDGNLWIRAGVGNWTDLWFETARVQSKEQISFPMYIECRIKAANISAYNTFWLNNGDANNRDEIDICENVANPVDGDDDLKYILNSQYFIAKGGNVERSAQVNVNGHYRRVAAFDNRNLSDDNEMKGKTWSEEYHVLGCYWKDAYNIQYYINGEEAGADVTKSPFTRRLNVIWDLWTQPHDGGITTKDRLNSHAPEDRTMYIDWVKTYTYDPNNMPNDNSEVEVNNFDVYPNPSKGNITINTSTTVTNGAIAKFINNTGAIVKTVALTSSEEQVSIDDLTAGFYIVKIINGNEVETERVTKL